MENSKLTEDDHDGNLKDPTLTKSGTTSRRRQASASASSHVIMRTKSKYHPAMYFILIFPLLIILVPLYISLTTGDHQTAWGLIWSLTFCVFVYMMVLPRTVDVRSNGVVGVKTSLMTYKFTDVVRAYEIGWSTEELLRPRFKFATDFSKRVSVRRRNGKWDILVSPVDIEEFIAAVNNNSTSEDQDEETGLHREDLSKQ